MEKVLKNIDEHTEFVKENLSAVVYFSADECNVCKVLKPKLKELLGDDYPETAFAYVNVNNSRELASQNSVFSIPTILVYFEGREFFRKSRNISLAEFDNEMQRPYSLFYSQ